LAEAKKNEMSYVDVGWVSDAHSLKGEIFIRLKAKRADYLEDLTEVRLVDASGNKISLFTIISASPHKDGLIVSLEGITTRTQAEALKQRRVQIDAQYLVAPVGERMYLREMLGFSVTDLTLGLVGQISGFSSNGPQDLLVIENTKGQKFEVPLVDDFIVEWRPNTKALIMDLPPGLIEV
jgi:16S rRNA processing protein RimM